MVLQELVDGTPDPAMFFTLYCERARDVERETGSTETALQLLDSALNGVGGCRLARRFITATRNSLLRYRAHLGTLVARLNSGEVEGAERAQLLETIRALDWREYEKKSVRTVVVPIEEKTEPEQEQFVEFEASMVDWSDELEIMEAILGDNLDEALGLAQKNVYFASVSSLIRESPEKQIWWLKEYCRCVAEELKDCELIIPASLCGDAFSTAIRDEDSTSLLLLKTRMALQVLYNKV